MLCRKLDPDLSISSCSHAQTLEPDAYTRKHHENLQRRNPRNGRGRVLLELVLFVVILENPDTCHDLVSDSIDLS